VLLQEGKLENFPPWWNDVVRDELVLVKEGKLTHVSYPPWWNDVIRYALVLVQEEKLACASFPPWLNVVRETLVLVQDGKASMC
jgi:hypothetical protein